MESDSVADVKGFDRIHFNHWRGLGSQPMSGWVGGARTQQEKSMGSRWKLTHVRRYVCLALRIILAAIMVPGHGEYA